MGRVLMARVTLRYVQAFTDRHGRMRYYFRKGGRQTPLPGSPQDPAFLKAYEALMAEHAAPANASTGNRDFEALIRSYYASADWAALKPSSRPGYRSHIEALRAQMGKRLVHQMRREHVMTMMARMASTPGAANNRLKRLRGLLRHARDLGWIDTDPSQGVRLYRSGEFHTWTPAEMAMFEAHWPQGSQQRLAYALHLYTGQRKSDVRKMGWGDIEGGMIRVTQEKGGARLWIPLHPELQAELARHARRHVIILASERGAQRSDGGYGNWFRAACKAAGLPDRCSSHGLRKAAAVNLAETGCTAHEIAAITGHKSLSEVERYTRAASQKRLARTAMERLTVKPAPAKVSNLKKS